MEKAPHDEYRDELAEKLKEIRNSNPDDRETAKVKAQGYLEAKQDTEEYKKAEKAHTEERQDDAAEKQREAAELAEQKELELHLREWMLDAAKDKEMVKKYFEVLDMMIDNGIYLRSNREDIDATPVGTDEGGFYGESRVDYNIPKLESEVFDLINVYTRLRREIGNNDGKTKFDMEALIKKAPSLSYLWYAGGTKYSYMPSFILGASKVQHENKMSWEYRSSPERLAKFAKFAEKFKRTPEEVKEIKQQIEQLKTKVPTLKEEILKAMETLKKYGSYLNPEDYQINQKDVY